MSTLGRVFQNNVPHICIRRRPLVAWTLCWQYLFVDLVDRSIMYFWVFTEPMAKAWQH